MKRIHLMTFLILLLTGCAKTYYGVSKDVWVAMNDPQKQAAIEGYNQRELLRTQHWIEREKLRDLSIAEEKKIQIEKDSRRYDNVENSGELVQVALLSGEIRIGRKSRPMEPFSVRLRNGEVREFTVRTMEHKHMSYTARITIQYDNGLLIIGPQRSGRGGIRIPYEHSWLRGAKYKAVKGSGRYKMKKMNIVVTVFPKSRKPAIVIY